MHSKVCSFATFNTIKTSCYRCYSNIIDSCMFSSFARFLFYIHAFNHKFKQNSLIPLSLILTTRFHLEFFFFSSLFFSRTRQRFFFSTSTRPSSFFVSLSVFLVFEYHHKLRRCYFHPSSSPSPSSQTLILAPTQTNKKKNYTQQVIRSMVVFMMLKIQKHH